MQDSVDFQKIFLELIEDLDCVRSEIPKKIGIEYSTFKNIVDYGKFPKPVVLIRIADYFNISFDYLIGFSDSSEFERSTSNNSFLIRFELLKKENGYTDYAISKKLHTSTSYTTRWKKHNSIPSLDNLIILSEIFCVSLDYLLGRSDYKH